MLREREFAQIISDAGGRAYLVGGAVRDNLRGVPCNDRDYTVTGLSEDTIRRLFPDALKVGRSFPVYLIEIDRVLREVALARTERKVGSGYRGFSVTFDPTVTIEQDLFRRDTTINAMAIDILSGALIDPFGGYNDVMDKKIRAVSYHFIDDPVRAIRAARQAAQIKFEITDATFYMMNLCALFKESDSV